MVATDFADAVFWNPPSARGASLLAPGKGNRAAPLGFFAKGWSKLNLGLEPEKVTIADVIARSDSGSPHLEPNGNGAFSTLSVRAVEIIAKPGRIRQLHECIRERVVEFLEKRSEFSSAIILTSPKEPRLAVVLTFWTSEEAALQNRWEEKPEIRTLMQPLIDVRSRVHTYEAALRNSHNETCSGTIRNDLRAENR